EAERLSRRALIIREQAYGPEDVRLAPALDNLAMFALKRHRIDAALELSERSCDIVRRKYGDHHPLTGQRLNTRGLILGNLRRYGEATELLHTSLEIQLDTSGENNIDVAFTMANLAAVTAHQGSYDDAASLYRRAIDIVGRIRGPDDDELGQLLLNY